MGKCGCGLRAFISSFNAFTHPPQLQAQKKEEKTDKYKELLLEKDDEGRERRVWHQLVEALLWNQGAEDQVIMGRMVGVGSGMRSVETLLRLLLVAPCVAALVVMLKNTETNDFGSISYSILGAFRSLVHANEICAGYSLLSAVVVAVPRPSTMPRAWTFFLLDQLLAYLILAAGVVSTEVVYLAYKGDEAITWSRACGSYGGFCKKATASIAITFVVGICYALLSLISSYRLFSKYDAPVAYNDKGIEVAAFGS